MWPDMICFSFKLLKTQLDRMDTTGKQKTYLMPPKVIAVILKQTAGEEYVQQKSWVTTGL